MIAESEKDADYYQASAKNIKLKFDTDRAEIEKRIRDLEKKIAQHKKAIEKENPEKRQKRLAELEELLPTLQQEAKDARKNYLLETYRGL